MGASGQRGAPRRLHGRRTRTSDPTPTPTHSRSSGATRWRRRARWSASLRRDLGFGDGDLENDVRFRALLVERIRRHDRSRDGARPTAVFFGEHYFNHRDHRSAGWALLDAVSPAAGLPHYFPAAGSAHQVPLVFLSGTLEPDVWVQVDETIDVKVAAVDCHKSQFAHREDGRRRPSACARRTRPWSGRGVRGELPAAAHGGVSRRGACLPGDAQGLGLERAILHVDMDAFSRRRSARQPELAGLPVIVGGTGGREWWRRAPTRHARTASDRPCLRCGPPAVPDAVFVDGHYSRYSEVSQSCTRSSTPPPRSLSRSGSMRPSWT